MGGLGGLTKNLEVSFFFGPDFDLMLRSQMAAEVVFFFLGKWSIGHKTNISMITNQSCSQNRTALYLNLLIMDDHNDYDHNEILSEYWHIDTPSSASDDSGDTEDELMDLTGIFITLIIEQVVLYGKTLYKKVPYHTSALTGEMWVLIGHPE